MNRSRSSRSLPAPTLDQKQVTLPARLSRLLIAAIIGSSACVALVLVLITMEQSISAAPPARPLTEIITHTAFITHTAHTTHEMRVFANGSISDRFLDNNGRNQIDQDGRDRDATTIAILFDQHRGDTVDVGVQYELTPTMPITLNTASSIPGYGEDTHAVYASGALPYEVAQRTLATYTNNCVIMELLIRNIGRVSALTGGKLLYMVDIDVAHHQVGDEGVYDPARRLVYLRDHNPSSPIPGFAMGVSLLQGDWRGYGVRGDGYPTLDIDIKDEMTSPMNAIDDGNNDVVWLVANIPDLGPGDATTLSFGLCARNADTEDQAAANLIESFDRQASLLVSKTATPSAGSLVVPGETLAYSVIVANAGYHCVSNVVITDVVPASTDLITYNVSQGSIVASDRLITASIGQLDPDSDPVTITLVVAPSITSTNSTVISNQAFVQSEPIVTHTNLVTHEVVTTPVLRVLKRARPEQVAAGEVLSYAVIISNDGWGRVSGVVVSDTLPAHTQLVPNSITIDPRGAGIVGTELPTLAHDITIAQDHSVTITFAVAVTKPWTDGTVVTNTVSVTSTQFPTPVTSTTTTTVTTTPAVNIAKSGPIVAKVGDTAVFTFTVTNIGNTMLQDVTVEDNYAGVADYVSGDNSDGWLDLTEAWVYTASHVMTSTATNPLINTATVTAIDPQSAAPVIATDTHATLIEFAPVLTITKSGPTTAGVGETVAFIFTVTHDDVTGDGSPLGSVSVSDDYAGVASYVEGDDGNGLLEVGEVWTYTVGYVIRPTDPTPLVNTGTVVGEDADGDLISATAVHSTDIQYAPGLNITKIGPTTAGLGETVVYTFVVGNVSMIPTSLHTSTDGDGSPVSDVAVTDSIAHPVTCVSGDDGDGLLEMGEVWICAANYVVQDTDPDPLVNVATVTGRDGDADLVTATDDHSLDIDYRPVLAISQDGSDIAAVDSTVVLTLTIVNDSVNGDSSPVNYIAVTNDIADTPIYVAGDDGDGLLEAGESWIYTASYAVQAADPSPLVNTCTVTGEDMDGDPISAIHKYGIPIGSEGNYSIFLPFVLKNN